MVSIFYANRLSYSIWNTIPGKYIREELEQNGVTYNELIKYWDITDPSQALPKVNKDNVLLISAKHDQYIDLKDADYLWESWGDLQDMSTIVVIPVLFFVAKSWQMIRFPLYEKNWFDTFVDFNKKRKANCDFSWPSYL